MNVTPVATGELRPGPARYFGFSVKESTGYAPATITVYDGQGGIVLDAIVLAPGQSDRAIYADGGVPAQHGVYVVLTGSVIGSIRHD